MAKIKTKIKAANLMKNQENINWNHNVISFSSARMAKIEKADNTQNCKGSIATGALKTLPKESKLFVQSSGKQFAIF